MTNQRPLSQPPKSAHSRAPIPYEERRRWSRHPLFWALLIALVALGGTTYWKRFHEVSPSAPNSATPRKVSAKPATSPLEVEFESACKSASEGSAHIKDAQNLTLLTQMAQCYVIAGYFQRAFKTMEPIAPAIEKISPETIDKKDDEHANAVLTLVDTMLRLGNVHESQSLTARHCPRWDAQPWCVARLQALQVSGMDRTVDEGARKLTPLGKNMPSLARVRLWFVTALDAAQVNRQEANIAFDKALSIRTNSIARRLTTIDVARARALMLFRAGDQEALVKLRGDTRRDVPDPSHPIHAELDLLVASRVDKSGPKEIHRFLDKRDRHTRHLANLDLIEAMAPVALRFGRSKEYAALARSSLQVIQSNYPPRSLTLNRARVNMARASLALDQPRAALKELESARSAFGVTTEIQHLFGIATTRLIQAEHESPRAAWDRAREFFAAANSNRPSVISLCAERLSAARAGRKYSSSDVAARLKAQPSDSFDAHWLRLTEAELAITSGQNAKAISILETEIKRHPNSEFAAISLTRATATDPTASKRAVAALNALRERVAVGNTTDALWGPFGPLALTPIVFLRPERN